jgi:hypothetical protein
MKDTDTSSGCSRITLMKKGIDIVAAKGYGDQSIYWDLENDLIVVSTAGNYENPDIKNNT